MTSNKDPKFLPEGNSAHLIEAHIRPEPHAELLETGKPLLITADAEPLHYQEDLADMYGYEFDAVALAEIELASADEVPEEFRTRLLLCQDPENAHAYGLLEVDMENRVVGEYVLPQPGERTPTEVMIGREGDEDALAALPGLQKRSISRQHLKLTITNEGVAIEDLGSKYRTAVTEGAPLEIQQDTEHNEANIDTVPRQHIEEAVAAVVTENELPSDTEEIEENTEDEPKLETDPDSILKNHFTELVQGKAEIEGVDPEVAHQLRGEVGRLITIWRDVQSEQQVGEVSAHISEVMQALVAEGTPLSEVQRNMGNAVQFFEEFSQVANRLKRGLYERNPEFAQVPMRQFDQLKDELIQRFGRAFFEVFEGAQNTIQQTFNTVEEELEKERRIRRSREDTIPTEQELEQLLELGNIEGIRAEIQSLRPRQNKVRSQRNAHEMLYTAGRRIGQTEELSTQINKLMRSIEEFDYDRRRGVQGSRLAEQLHGDIQRKIAAIVDTVEYLQRTVRTINTEVSSL